MKYRTRIYYTEEQKALMWDLWQEGESLSSIARLFDRNHSSVEGILKETGGIRPRPRRRSRLALTLSEREEISRGVAAGSDTGPTGPIKRPGSGRAARRSVNWYRTGNSRTAWHGSSRSCGPPSRLPGGSSASLPMRRTLRCRTRPSIEASLSRPAAP